MFLSCESLTKTYMVGEQKITALDHVDFSVEKGEFVAIVGESGSGKSTLLNMIGMIDRPTEGRIFLNRYYDEMDEKEKAGFRNRELGYVFQSFFIEPGYSVFKNVELPLLIQGVSKAERRKRAEEALDRVGLRKRINNRAADLSGGERQRVSIARALVTEPSLLLADEPCGNLDSVNTEEVLRLFEELNRSGTTILLVTHSAAEAERAGRIVRLRDGRVI